MKFFKKFGIDEIEKQVLSNSRYYINALAKIGFESPLYSLSDKYLSGIASFTQRDFQRTPYERFSKSVNEEKIFDHLSQKNIICSLREGYIRFAPHFYNTKQEINTVIDEMKKI